MTILLVLLALVTTIFVGLLLFTAYDTRRIERLFPAEGKFIDVNGARLHYVDRGQGPVIVLLHGLATQYRSFTYLADHLTKTHRVLFVDRPGAGYSTVAPGASASVRSQAAFVAGLIRQLGLERPAVAGHSLGGAVALALALDHPELVSRLAVVAPLTQPTSTVPPPFRSFAIRFAPLRYLVAWTLVAPLSRLRLKQEEMLRFVFRPATTWPDDFETAFGGPLLLRPRSFLATAADLGAASDDLPDMIKLYPGLQVPTRVLYGKDDSILDAKIHGDRLAQASPQVHLDLVEGGHMLPVTHPVQVANWIKGQELTASDFAPEPAVSEEPSRLVEAT